MGFFLGLLGLLMLFGGFIGAGTMPGIAGVQSICIFVAGAVLLGAGAIVERVQAVVKELRTLRESLDERAQAADRRAAPLVQPTTPTTGASAQSVTGKPIPRLRPDN